MSQLEFPQKQILEKISNARTSFIWDLIPENPGRKVREQDREEKAANGGVLSSHQSSLWVPGTQFYWVLWEAVKVFKRQENWDMYPTAPLCHWLKAAGRSYFSSTSIAKFMGRADTSGHREISQAEM